MYVCPPIFTSVASTELVLQLIPAITHHSRKVSRTVDATSQQQPVFSSTSTLPFTVTPGVNSTMAHSLQH